MLNNIGNVKWLRLIDKHVKQTVTEYSAENWV